MPKRELFERAWHGLSVDEANLRVQIFTLRKALGEFGDRIRAEAAVGYRFVSDATEGDGGKIGATARRSRVPRLSSAPLGRDEPIDMLAGLVGRHRAVTILGPGGIGKTTVALEVALRNSDIFADGACFVDLGRISAASQLIAAVASALDLPAEVTPSVGKIVRALEARRILLVLDSCEHLTEFVAALAEEVLAGTDGIHILATTRELLRASSEVVYRLQALPTPPADRPATAEDALKYPSVQLFLRVAGLAGASFEITDANAAQVAEVCRRLDGIPLAIELAASMTPFVGVGEICRGLDERFSLLTLGRRTALPRHRTLAATLDWSYDLLSGQERAALRCLATFAGPFDLDAATEVVAGEEMTSAAARDAIIGLVQKSLLSLEPGLDAPIYRLLDTTRAYALRAAGPQGERDSAVERHARYFLGLLDRMDWEAHDGVDARPAMRRHLAEVRSALDWAFSARSPLAISLTVAAERLWLELRSLSQAAPYLNLAWRQLQSQDDVNPTCKARVLVALASAHAFDEAPDRLTATYEEACRAAQDAGDAFLELRALYALTVHLVGASGPALDSAREFARISAQNGDQITHFMSKLLLAFAHYASSDFTVAAELFREYYSDCPPTPRQYELYFSFDLRVVGRAQWGIANYMLGRPKKAETLISSVVEEMERSGRVFNLMHILSYHAIWAALCSSDFLKAAEYLDKLERATNLYPAWRSLLQAYRGMMIFRQGGDMTVAETLLSEGINNSVRLRLGNLLPALLVELSDVRRTLGDFAGSEIALEQLLSCSRGDSDISTLARYYRASGSVLRARNGPGDIEDAKALFGRAIEIAKHAECYNYEFEATAALAELLLSCGQRRDAERLLSDVIARLPEDDDLVRRRHVQMLVELTP